MKKQSDVHVRVTAQEKSLMMRCAEKEGAEFSTWVRDRLFDGVRKGNSALEEGPVGQSAGTSPPAHNENQVRGPELDHVPIRETQGSVCADQAQAPGARQDRSSGSSRREVDTRCARCKRIGLASCPNCRSK